MTINHPRVLSVSLDRAVRALAGVFALPGVPTLDWCELSAKALCGAFPGAIIVVRVIDQDVPEGESVTVCEGAFDSFRAGPLNTSELSSEGETVSGWWMTPEALRALSATSPAVQWANRLAGFERWPATDLARRWSVRGAGEVLVGAISMTKGDSAGSRRLMTIELGASNVDPTDPEILAALLPELARRASTAFGSEPHGGNELITDREQEVLDLLIRGLNVREIAEELSRSPHTVHDHVKSLHRKLQATCRGELIARALGHREAASPAHRFEPVLTAPSPSGVRSAVG